MIVKTVGELKAALKEFPDTFRIDMKVLLELSKKTLSKRSYPYPYDSFKTELNACDVSYSENRLTFNCIINENEIVQYGKE